MTALAQALPRLQTGPHHVKDNALHRLYFTGKISTKTFDIHQEVTRYRPPSFDFPAPHEIMMDELVVTSESSISQRLFQNLLLPVQSALNKKILFGDSKIRDHESDPATRILPDFVGYVCRPSSLKEADGELKHWFCSRHSYALALNDPSDRRLRQITGQPVQNMLERGHLWCFWSSYKETAFFRLKNGREGYYLEVSEAITADQASEAQKASVREILHWAYTTNCGLGDEHPPTLADVEGMIVSTYRLVKPTTVERLPSRRESTTGLPRKRKREANDMGMEYSTRGRGQDARGKCL